VFVEKESPIYTLEPSNPIGPRAVPTGDRVFVQPRNELCRWTGLRLLEFDKRGDAVWRTSEQLCTAAAGIR